MYNLVIAPLITDLAEKLHANGNNIIVIPDQYKPILELIIVEKNAAKEREISDAENKRMHYDNLLNRVNKAATVQCVGNPMIASDAYKYYFDVKPGDRVIIRARTSYEYISFGGAELWVVPIDAILAVFQEPVANVTLDEYFDANKQSYVKHASNNSLLSIGN